MADSNVTIRLNMPTDEANAFARFLNRCIYTDCVARSSPIRKYADGRDEVDVMWSALRMVQDGFTEATGWLLALASMSSAARLPGMLRDRST
jgi:hypothetical protein